MAGSRTATCSAPEKAGRSRSCSIAKARDQFAAFFARGDSFALGVCNGCQMMSNLREMIPGAAHWPHFVRNASEQFEARFVAARGASVRRRCSSPAWRAAAFPWQRRTARVMPNSTTPRSSRAAQPPGRAALRRPSRRADRSVPLQSATARRSGITGLTTADGRFTILDAASGARVPHGADVVASRRMGRVLRRGCGCSATPASGSA